MWATGSGDMYPIHYDKDFAVGSGLPGIIVHGALKNAFLGQMLHDWIGEKGEIKKFNCQYRGMDVPGQDIICRGVDHQQEARGRRTEPRRAGHLDREGRRREDVAR